ncbi:hypothetical protein BDN71DRAFT_1510838 [Pleurotus eryngii]|uniref:Uncharacterized protein n=1 Tax=Pleurotus eryngii TaxID=5323 RepID=A0A9P5ZNT4_PLEER|nr:hypothetical protein BDN71DRAFT_1510838 [Pleurotus eryngii]
MPSIEETQEFIIQQLAKDQRLERVSRLLCNYTRLPQCSIFLTATSHSLTQPTAFGTISCLVSPTMPASSRSERQAGYTSSESPSRKVGAPFALPRGRSGEAHAVPQGILTIRTWAVWHSREIADSRPFLSLFFATAVWGPNFAVIDGCLHKVLDPAPPRPYPGFVGCDFVAGNQILFVTWALLMVYEASEQPPWRRWGTLTDDQALFTAVYRDGILYYLYLFVLSLINIAVIEAFPKYIIPLAAYTFPLPSERLFLRSLTTHNTLQARARGPLCPGQSHYSSHPRPSQP